MKKGRWVGTCNTADVSADEVFGRSIPGKRPPDKAQAKRAAG